MLFVSQVPPKKPFKRMNYSDAVKFCNEHEIYKDEEKKEHFVFGDVRYFLLPSLWIS